MDKIIYSCSKQYLNALITSIKNVKDEEVVEIHKEADEKKMDKIIQKQLIGSKYTYNW